MMDGFVLGAVVGFVVGVLFCLVMAVVAFDRPMPPERYITTPAGFTRHMLRAMRPGSNPPPPLGAKPEPPPNPPRPKRRWPRLL